MSLYATLLVLAVLGLVPSSCAVQNEEPFSGEGSTVAEEDWNGNSASGAGEDEQPYGFDSGSSWTDNGYSGETTHEFPRVSRNYSNKRSETSGDNGDKSGSGEDDGSKSNFHGNEDHGSTNSKFDSSLELSKVVDAVDILKKLKKAKSDEELVKKLKTGPETLGVAFKTFEQLSGLWISVMHRIWRVWKAKGAKVVMHSIVDNLMNNTGRTIKRKVEDFLSNNTDISQEKVSINFIKTIPKEEQPWPSNKQEKATIEKVKVSFKRKSANTSSTNNTSSSANMAEIDKGENSSETNNGSSYHMSNVGSRTKWGKRHPLEMQKPLESRYHRNIKNVSSGNFENQVGKNRETGRRVKVMSATEETENVPQLSEKSHIKGKQADSPRTINDQQKLLNNSFISQNPDTQGKETSHVKNTNTIKGHVSKESQNSDTSNSTAKMNTTLGKIEMEEANPTKNPTKKSSVPEKVKINFLIKGEGSQLDQNNRNIFQINTSRIEKRPPLFVQNETKPLTDSKGKSAELSKSLYLTRSDSGVVRNTSKSDIGALFAKKRFDNKTLENITPSPANSSSQLDNSKIQTNVLTSFTQNKSKSKPDSTGNAAELSKPSHSTTNISREKNILDKVALSFHDNATGNRSESDIDTPRVKEHFGNRTLENLAPALAKAENVFAETYRTKETQKSNSSFNEAKATTSSDSSLTDSFDKNNKIESYAARNVSNVPEGDSNKKQAGGSRNTTNIHDKMKYKVLGNLTHVLDKGVVNAKSQVEQKGKVLDNRMNLTVDSSNAKLQNEKEDVLSKKRTPNVAQEDFVKVSGSGRNVTDSNTIPQNDKVDVTTNERSQKGFQEDAPNAKHLNHSQTVTGKANSALVLHTQEHKENHSSQGAKEDNQEKLRNDKQEFQRTKTLSVTSSALHVPSRKLTVASKSSSVRYSLSTDVVVDEENDSHSSKSGVPTEHALKGTKRDKKTSPADSSRNSKTNSMVEKVTNNDKAAERKETHTQEIDAKRVPGLIRSNIQLNKEHDTVHDSGSGNDIPHGVSATPEKPENPTANDQGSAVTKDKAKNKLQGSESIVSFDPAKTVAYQKEHHMTRQSKGGKKRERKSGIPYGEIVAIHNSQSRKINDQERTVTRKNKLGTIQRKASSLEKDPEEGLLTDKKHGDVTHQSKDVLTASPQQKVQYEPERVSPKVEKLVKINNGLLSQSKSNKLAIQVKVTSRISDKKSSSDSNDEPRRHSTEHSSEDIERKESLNETKKEVGVSSTDTRAQNQTHEDKAHPKSQQVDVLTSRTPPTSLLTTSNDDNAYSIKEIVQGPKGPSLISVHSDNRRIHGLEKKVVRLEDKVTVLETAMAGLARRILDVEQNTVLDHPIPTTPTLLPPSNVVKLQHKHPINNQQQTTVYITKEVSAPPQTVAPQNGPQKIVIPISSLRSGGGRGVSTYPASIQEIDDNKEVEDDIHSDKRLEDNTHVTVPLAPSASPSSQAQAIVRPIVNIIVPNNRADELSTEATCLPRCQNGGRCLEGNTCRCPTFFSGVHCEKFSLKDLLESPRLRERTNRKLRRVVLSELPDQQDVDGTLSLDSGSPAVEYKNLDQVEEPDKVFIARQKPIDLTPPRNSADAQGVTRRRQFILEI